MAAWMFWRHMRAALMGLLCIAWGGWVAAHPMPESRVWIDTTPGGLRLTVQLPLAPLESAFGQELADFSGTVLAQHGEELSRYLLLHVGARSGNIGWQTLRPQLAVQGHNASAELEAVVELRAPAGADARSPTLLFDAVTHEVRTHRVQVFLRNDWEGDRVGQAPLLLGELDFAHNSLPLVLAQNGGGASFRRLLQAGAMHIAEGSDHLLFLLMLLTVAPLHAQARRWAQRRSVEGEGGALRQLGWVVTAFTLGHSCTLALGSSGVLVPPEKWVEVAVAATIAVAALHALRPLLRQGEVWMALGFGLVHGLAFSSSLSGAGLTLWQHAQALLAFNLGIEAMQLLLVLLAMPALLYLSRTRAAWYVQLRRVLALLGLGLAGAWMLDRLGWWTFDAPTWAVEQPWVPVGAVGALWLLAVAAASLRRPRHAWG